MVVYGSETRLLAPLYDRPNTFFIKIYNQSRPAEIDQGNQSHYFYWGRFQNAAVFDDFHEA